MSKADQMQQTPSKANRACKSKKSIDPQNIAPAPYFHYTDRSREVDEDPLTPLAPPYRIPNFLVKLFCILSRDDLRHIIKWLPHGRSWRIIDPVEFEMSVIPTYFGHSSMNSFLRQVNGWGFKRMTQGRNKNSYYNEYFLRGLPHLCKKAPRPSNVASIYVDSKYEPDMYAISDEHPVPEEIDSLVPCGASIEMIDQGIRNHGPKGRVPLTQSRPEDDDTSPLMMPLMSGCTSQLRLLSKYSKQSPTKKAKFSHHHDAVNPTNNNEGADSSWLLPFPLESSRPPQGLVNNTNGMLQESRASFSGNKEPSSASLHSSLAGLDRVNRRNPLFYPSRTSSIIISNQNEQAMQLQRIISEHMAKQEREFLIRIQQQLLQQRRQEEMRQQHQMIVDRILQSSELPCSSTIGISRAPNYEALQEMIRKAILDGALMGYYQSISKRK